VGTRLIVKKTPRVTGRCPQDEGSTDILQTRTSSVSASEDRDEGIC
jgi:hypothetical protein